MTKRILISSILIMLSFLVFFVYVFLIDNSNSVESVISENENEEVENIVVEDWTEEELILELDKRFNEGTGNASTMSLDDYYESIRKEFK